MRGVIAKPVRLVLQLAVLAWVVFGAVVLFGTYGPMDAASLPVGWPRLTRVVLAGAQDSSAAGFSLITFKEASGCGHRWPLDGGMQRAPLPAYFAVLGALLFAFINVGGPPVQRREH